MRILEDVVVTLFTYCQEDYIEEAIVSIYEQTVFPKKFIIIDDNSTDNTKGIIDRIVKIKPDELDVEVRFSDVNKRLIGQINTLKDEFNDKLIIFQAGDDVARPYRIERLYNSWIDKGKPYVMHSSYADIDKDGKTLNTHLMSLSKPRSFENVINRKITLGGCTQAFSSKVLNDFPTIDRRVFAEDRIIIFRGMLLGKVSTVDEVLLDYRLNVGVSYTKRDTNKEILASERGYLLKELGELNQNIIDSKLLNNNCVAHILERRVNYVNFILNKIVDCDSSRESMLIFVFNMIREVDFKYFSSLLRKRKRFKSLKK